MMQKSAEQLFAVLGELKGGAMKFGQALSVFEAAIPDEFAEPFREALVKLQTAAPPMPVGDVHTCSPSSSAGAGTRGSSSSTRRRPRRPASGRCTAAVWRRRRARSRSRCSTPAPRRPCARTCASCRRMSRLLQPLAPGLELKPLIDELRERMEEELDYRDEAAYQREFAAAYDGDDAGPRAGGRRVGAEGDGQRVGDRAAALGGDPGRARTPSATTPARCSPSSTTPRRHGSLLLHADPHPGNFQILDDGRLIVVDFGAVARLPDGMPRPLVDMTKLALSRTGPTS